MRAAPGRVPRVESRDVPRRAGTVLLALALGLAGGGGTFAASPAITSVYRVPHPRGLMVTSGGWPYCAQVRRLARNTGYTLLCGRFQKDGYVGPGLRRRRRLDWGNASYLASLARQVRSEHARVGGELLLIGVSYSGFGVATLATHHPTLRPDRLIVIDSYFDLVGRRTRLPPRHETAREIDDETGGTRAALRGRSAAAAGLARLVRAGTRVTVIWTVSQHEKRLFAGATCDRETNARMLSRLARALRRRVPGWVTRARHGQNLWNHGREIVGGRNPGKRFLFEPSGRIPPGSYC